VIADAPQREGPDQLHVAGRYRTGGGRRTGGCGGGHYLFSPIGTMSNTDSRDRNTSRAAIFVLPNGFSDSVTFEPWDFWLGEAFWSSTWVVAGGIRSRRAICSRRTRRASAPRARTRRPEVYRSRTVYGR